MRKAKICLIVDNPLRDLDGLVLLGAVLARKGADVFLVPMYTQGYEVPAIGPDLVLMNYARTANVDLIKAYHDAGILVGILDTEGGIWESEEQFVKSIAHKECVKYIDLYCLWGEKQFEALLSLTEFSEKQLKITGNPRYDFYSSPWINAVENPYDNSKPFILMTSSFALSNPRFSRNAKVEIANMIESGYEKNYVLKRLTDEVNARRELISTIKRLSSDFASVDVVIRPHPFEDESEYARIFNEVENVKIKRDDTITSWLKTSMCVLHLNSSIAIDSYIMGKVPISLDWINTDVIREMSEITYEVSYKAKSYNELKSTINNVLNGSGGVVNSRNSDQVVNDKIESWFYLADGKASYRVADAVMEAVSNRRHKLNSTRCKRMLLFGSRNPGSAKGWCDGLGRIILGPRIYNFLRTWILTRNIRGTKNIKAIRINKVAGILGRLNDISDTQKCEVTRVSRKNTILARTAGNSVHIKPKHF